MLEAIKIFDYASKLQAAFTAAATNLITSAAHGLLNDDLVHVSSTGTLPAGLSASTDYYVIDATTNTFQLSATMGGAAVDITDTGSGTHSFHLKGKKVLCKGGEHIELSVHTNGSANFNLKIQKSQQSNVDFNAAQSVSNRWDYAQIIDLNDGIPYDGDSGITLSGIDDNREFEININGSTWVTVVISSWVAGTIDAKISLYSN